MEKNKINAVIQILIAALLFGASTPFNKILLDYTDPLPLASFLYLGSGVGLFLFQTIKKIIIKKGISEASLKKADIPWLAGAILTGGIAAPILLMFSLKATPASTASMLLNFESVATTIIAVFFFKEAIGKRIWIAVACVTIASIILTFNFEKQWGLSIGAAGIIFTCIFWGLDNNFTRNISSKNPFSIVTIKGFAAGLFSLLLSFLFKNPLPSIKIILIVMLVGFFGYGLSIVLFVYSMRVLGSSRASSLFGTAPFIGTILSFILFRNMPGVTFIISLPIMIFGVVFLLRETHMHEHIHELLEHDHKHFHEDEHHNHIHSGDIRLSNGYHSHGHTHINAKHRHDHTPDIHHRHSHKSK